MELEPERLACVQKAPPELRPFVRRFHILFIKKLMQGIGFEDPQLVGELLPSRLSAKSEVARQECISVEELRLRRSELSGLVLGKIAEMPHAEDLWEETAADALEGSMPRWILEVRLSPVAYP